MVQINISALFLLVSLLLSGCMPAVVGVAANSANALAKDRDLAQTIDDVKIASAIKASFIKNNFNDLYTRVNVEVLNGRVLYTGTILEEEDSITAVQIAWNQKGVTEVINEIKIDKNKNKFDVVQFTKDTMITAQIKSRILANRSIKFSNYTIITANNVVYIFGIARSADEMQAVGDIAARVHGVSCVISHVKEAISNK